MNKNTRTLKQNTDIGYFFASLCKSSYLAVTIAFFFSLSSSATALEALTVEPNRPATNKTSYEYRQLERRGVKSRDPNIYVYNRQFAKRFQMPSEWVSNDLRGVDAVAFRIEQDYDVCGWGGDNNACQTNAIICKIDMYFGQTTNPLPWDNRMPAARVNSRGTSTLFIRSLANRIKDFKGETVFTQFFPRSPFADPITGQEMVWMYADSEKDSGHGSLIKGYTREMFPNMSMITFLRSCGEFSPDHFWLGKGVVRDNPTNHPDAVKIIELPKAWQERVEQAQEERSKAQAAFLKQQGLKALKAIKDASKN